jgi:hypothetical protein
MTIYVAVLDSSRHESLFRILYKIAVNILHQQAMPVNTGAFGKIVRHVDAHPIPLLLVSSSRSSLI